MLFTAYINLHPISSPIIVLLCFNHYLQETYFFKHVFYKNLTTCLQSFSACRFYIYLKRHYNNLHTKVFIYSVLNAHRKD